MDNSEKPKSVAIVGGGLVGALSACYFGKRGYKVDLYEYRKDVRGSEAMRGRSINLALSRRGRRALAGVGLEEDLVRRHGVPMSGRMIHAIDGTKSPILYDPVNNQCIYSVGRNYLNGVLLSAAEKCRNVRLHFEHKLVHADFDKGSLSFKSGDKFKDVNVDLVVGADGAYSTVRKDMMKLPMFSYSQTYIEHGYLELCIRPGPTNEWAMENNYLHIWPRGGFMMIALPNADRSWTVTLFMPHKKFADLDSPKAVVQFFRANFPDALALIGPARLVEDFFATEPSSLVSIKCKPYHVGSKAVIIGDAAHAMVPFYGQGMNAGFEDCFLLDDLLHNQGLSIGPALEMFSRTRNPDAEAICDLAMYNYIEMRDLVTRSSFIWRKRLDNLLFRLMPKVWIPLYTSVTFSDIKYSKCIANRRWQDSVLKSILLMSGLAGLSVFGTFLFINKGYNILLVFQEPAQHVARNVLAPVKSLMRSVINI